MNPIAEILFVTLGLVIGGGIITALLIAMDERKNFRRSLRQFDEQ